MTGCEKLDWQVSNPPNIKLRYLVPVTQARITYYPCWRMKRSTKEERIVEPLFMDELKWDAAGRGSSIGAGSSRRQIVEVGCDIEG